MLIPIRIQRKVMSPVLVSTNSRSKINMVIIRIIIIISSIIFTMFTMFHRLTDLITIVIMPEM
ncbi:hypothetical protein Ciccas_014307 [Cichlidogyrus casuarinus]|uniref:Uncharacterized protein n=1 Tax=Cichlidogyrus casuarinus TaxID=1844966 RepID=A0ABD2PII5_9PLAT